MRDGNAAGSRNEDVGVCLLKRWGRGPLTLEMQKLGCERCCMLDEYKSLYSLTAGLVGLAD